MSRAQGPTRTAARFRRNDFVVSRVPVGVFFLAVLIGGAAARNQLAAPISAGRTPAGRSRSCAPRRSSSALANQPFGRTGYTSVTGSANYRIRTRHRHPGS